MTLAGLLRHPTFGDQYLAGPAVFRAPALRGTLAVSTTVYGAALPVMANGERPHFVLVQHSFAGNIPVYATPYYSAHSFGFLELFMATGVNLDRPGYIMNVAGCTHLAMSCLAPNVPVSVHPLENRSIRMIGPPVLRTAATRQQLGAVAENIALPANANGERPKYVMIGSETSAVILGMGAVTGDATAAADLGILITLNDGPIILDVQACDLLRVASLTTPWVRVAALENGGGSTV